MNSTTTSADNISLGFVEKNIELFPVSRSVTFFGVSNLPEIRMSPPHRHEFSDNFMMTLRAGAGGVWYWGSTIISLSHDFHKLMLD